MLLLVLMGIAALVGVLTLISEKFSMGQMMLAEGRHARIIGALLIAPIAYTFASVIIYGLLQAVTPLQLNADSVSTMNMLQYVVTFGAIFLALAYGFIRRSIVSST